MSVEYYFNPGDNTYTLKCLIPWTKYYLNHSISYSLVANKYHLEIGNFALIKLVQDYMIWVLWSRKLHTASKV